METITFEGMEYHVLAYLVDIAGRVKEIDRIRERIAGIGNGLGVRGIAYSGMPKSPSAYGRAVPDGVARLVEQRERHADALAANADEIDRAWSLCSPRISSNRQVLWLKYVQGMPWSKVAAALHVSERHVYRMRVDGITELYGRMPERWRVNSHDAV